MNINVKLICIGIYLFHFAVAQVILPWANTINFFPFYDWNLFSVTYPDNYWALIRINEINHEKLENPPLVFHGDHIKNAKSYWRVPEQTRRLLRLLREKGPDDLQTQNARYELENNLFANYEQVKYEAIWGKINVRESLYKDNVKEVDGLWEFEYQKVKR